MTQRLLMGNEAIALGAIAAGVNVVAGYPGTPSTEVLETVAAHNPGDIHVEWSTNEKAALEVCGAASMSGARSLVTMKQVGLNVASDPLMSLAYVGIKGGMVVLVADDPGPISSQTEQDTRTFSRFAKLPCFDPASPEEALAMMSDAFELSERYGTPVIMRPTTRVCHACASLEVPDHTPHDVSGFEKSSDWVIFPKRALKGHEQINERLPRIADEFASYPFNTLCDVLDEEDADEYRADSITGSRSRGIVTAGVSDAYALEALNDIEGSYRLFHVATPHPFPNKLALEFLSGLDEVLVLEELDPFIERALLELVGREHLEVDIRGKLSGDAPAAGENSVENCGEAIRAFFSQTPVPAPVPGDFELPTRPPVLCAGCPHRGSFYAVKQALSKDRQSICCGDIGCYTLGNAMPLDMVDTCLCMGGGITMAQGMKRANPDADCLAFVGDSTFFASGITGVINAFYNQNDITLFILDNSTTAMTGQQPHPGTGITMMGEQGGKVSIESVLRGIGIEHVAKADPRDLGESTRIAREAIEAPGLSVVIFEGPCINLIKPSPQPVIDEDKCTCCKKCITQLGCPAIVFGNGSVSIDDSLCYGCGICVGICPSDAIVPAGGGK